MKLKSLLALIGCLLLITGVSVKTIFSQDGADGPRIVVKAGEESILGIPSINEYVDETVTVYFLDANGSPITSVNRGTPFQVWGEWSTPIDGYKAIFIGLVTWSGGKNTVIVSRTSSSSGIIGTSTWVVAPTWANSGPVTFVAKIGNRGTGTGTITLN